MRFLSLWLNWWRHWRCNDRGLFFLGFNLGRQFSIKAPKGKKARAAKSAGGSTK